MSKKIIFIKGQIETLDFFIEKLCQGADELGIDYYILDVNDSTTFTSTDFYSFINAGDCVVFTMNQIGTNLLEEDENFWEKHNIPVYSFIQDHPYNYDKSLGLMPNDSYLFVLDRDHKDFIERCYRPFKDIYFLPNGGWEVNSGKPYRERPIDIFYGGSCNPKQAWVRIPFFEDGGKEFYKVCYDALIQNPFLTIEQVIELYCQECANLSFDIQKKLIIDYGFILMHNVRRHFKLLAMHALERTGAYIEIRGDGWNDDGEIWAPNVHIRGRVSSEECNRLSGDAKIGLNFMPWYKRGCSERVFNIMLNASVCLTDTSEYLLERFQHGNEVVYFNYEDMDGLVADVRFLLDNPEVAEAIAARGYKVSRENDTWKHRMREIYDTINMYE